jgi:hypothetical protein
MNRAFLVVLLITATLITKSQRPNTPLFSDEVVSFKSAKIAMFNLATKKADLEKYKDCSILIENATDHYLIIATIDLPDVFYMKQGQVATISEKMEVSGRESFTYQFVQDKKIATLTMSFANYGDTEPDYIVVVGSLPNGKDVAARLSEFK